MKHQASSPKDVIQLHVKDIAPNEGVEAVRGMWDQAKIRFELAPQGDLDTEFEYRARVRRLENSSFYDSVGSPLAIRRTSRHLEDGKDSLCIIVSRGESTVLDDAGRELRISAGQGALASMARSHGLVNHGSFGHSRSIHVDRKALGQFLPHIDDAHLRLVNEATPGFALLRSYVNLISEDPLETPELRHAADIHLAQLFAIVAGATGDALQFSIENGAAAARMRVIKADILKRLTSHNLKLETIAFQHGITPRHLQRLFERDGTSFSEFLREARLSRSYELLTNPRRLNMTILTIAYECGFADITTFNRSFRRRYGMTPSDARREATFSTSGS